MNKLIILSIVCFTIANGNLKDDIKDKAASAVNQGEKLKVQWMRNFLENLMVPFCYFLG